MKFFIFIFFIFFSFSKVLAQVNWGDVREQVSKKQWAQSVSTINLTPKDKINEGDSQLRLFALGVFLYNKNEFYSARGYLREYVSQKGRLNSYAFFYLGQISLKLNSHQEAEKYFKQVVHLKAPRFFVNTARFELGKMDLKNKKYRSAYRKLKKVESQWRSNVNYPSVAWLLLQAELGRKRSWRACLWARKLYSKYPTHTSVNHWGLSLSGAMVNGRKLNCIATFEHQKQRIRRLHWAGLNNRALQEIDTWVKQRETVSPYYRDILYASHYLYEGDGEKALERLKPHYKSNKKNYKFIMLLAKVSDMVGNYNAASGAYFEAYKLTPRHRKGRAALFKSAFLSYQNQDYDRAIFLLNILVKKHRRSGLTMDAHWYLGWIKYLKGDYIGSISEINYMKKNKKRYSRRWRRIPDDKLNYWLAMSYLRLGDLLSAERSFSYLLKGNTTSFYNLAARARLLKIKPNLIIARQSLRGPSSDQNVEPETNTLPPSSTVKEEDEVFNDSLIAEDEPETFFEDLIEAESSTEATNNAFIESVSDEKIKFQFQQIKDLIRIGLNHEAKWGLYEIERKTRKEIYKKALLSAYNGIKAFHRSSYISQVYFSQKRNLYGMEKGKYLWEHAYPKVFKTHVVSNSLKFNVDQNFIWSIIRAESFYRPEINSPVGARGLMQMMPATGQQVSQLLGEPNFETSTLYTPKVNVKLGSRYLQRLLKVFGGSYPLASASYNAGPHRVHKWLHHFGRVNMDEFIEHIPYRETRNYVKKVIKNFAVYKALYEKDNTPVTFLSEAIGVETQNKNFSKESWGSID